MMSDKKDKMIFLIPAPGRRTVRDPLTRAVMPKEGETKPDNAFWRRRIKMVDVVRGKSGDVKAEPVVVDGPSEDTPQSKRIKKAGEKS